MTQILLHAMTKAARFPSINQPDGHGTAGDPLRGWAAGGGRLGEEGVGRRIVELRM